MNPTQERFLTAARAEGGMPVSAGHPDAPRPTPEELAAFDVALSTAKGRFLTAARAEGGMPVSAGWAPESKEAPADDALDQRLLPSQKDAARLPRWARVAFAARCARRVLPLYRRLWPTAPPPAEHARLVELAEQAAGAANPHTASDAVTATRPSVNASDAIHAVAIAAHAAAADPDAYAISYTEYAAQTVLNLLARVATVRTVHTLAAPGRDFARLVRLAKERNWTDDTPVPPDVFGPMWDGDPPPW